MAHLWHGVTREEMGMAAPAPARRYDTGFVRPPRNSRYSTIRPSPSMRWKIVVSSPLYALPRSTPSPWLHETTQSPS
jgi:hypothetical protein